MDTQSQMLATLRPLSSIANIAELLVGLFGGVWSAVFSGVWWSLLGLASGWLG